MTKVKMREYECKIRRHEPITLRALESNIPGRMVWAYVPYRNGVKRKIVFVADNEPPVQSFIIENFSCPVGIKKQCPA